MSSVVISGDTSGAITLSAPAVAGTNTITLPALTGNAVLDTAIQTLTNKTLTSPTINSPTISGTPVMSASVITSGTAQASTSGTNIDFTNIPSWVKRITVMFAGVSTNGTSNYQIQIGSGSITSSGYSSGASNGSNLANSTSAFLLSSAVNATQIYSGHVVLTLVSSNNWVQSGTLGSTGANYTNVSGGSVALSGTLDRVRITTVNGTDTFDAGSINILYE